MLERIRNFLRPTETHGFGSATKFYTELATYFGAIAASLAAFFAIRNKVPPEWPSWALPVITVVPLCVAFLRSLLNGWGRAAPAPLSHPRFQLTPLTSADRDQFERADRIHDIIFDWIMKSTEPVLYITGLSGAGKTSVINASVRPRLEEREDVAMLAIRGLDPIQARIKEKLTTSGVVWKEPADSHDALALLYKAGAKLKRDGKRLVILIDQFEELIRLAKDDPDRAKEVEFLCAAVASRAEAITLVFVLRDDWKVDLAVSGFPKLRQDENWKSVEPLYQGPAVEFLRSHGIEDEEMARNLVLRATEVDDAAGKLRLITLNIIGIIHARFPDLAHRYAGSQGRGGRMFTDYIRRVLGTGAKKLAGAGVLRALVTSSGDRKPPQTNYAIEKASNLDARQVGRTVLDLERQGLIREAGSGWEVSHDFLAKVLNGLFDSVIRSYVRMTTRAAVPLLLILWLAGGILVPSAWHLKERQRWKANFDESAGEYSEATSAVKFGSAWTITADGLRWVAYQYPQIKSLNLPSATAITDDSLRALAMLVNLETLLLSYSNSLTDEGLVHLSALNGLQSLTLINCRALTGEGFGDLSALTNLQSLNLSNCYALTAEGFRDLSALEGLQNLDLSGCAGLTDKGLAGLSALTNLQSLNLSRCKELTDKGVASLSALKSLQILYLDGCSALTGECFGDLSALTDLLSLSLSGCAGLTDKGLAGLSALEGLLFLDLSYCRALTGEGFGDLSALTNLLSLSLSVCDGLTDKGLAHLSALKGLHTLDFRGCRKLTSEGIRALANDLPNTEILWP